MYIKYKYIYLSISRSVIFISDLFFNISILLLKFNLNNKFKKKLSIVGICRQRYRYMYKEV